MNRALALGLALAGSGAIGSAAALEPSGAWADATSSPRPLTEATLNPLERAALRRCGAGDSGMESAARRMAERRARGAGLPDLSGIASLQRAAGEPHPWAAAWAATAPALTESITGPLDAWLARTPHEGLRRCGVATATAANGDETLVVLATEALADLAPLPTRARIGQWLTVEAQMLVGARGGKVFAAGPTGTPREIPAWFEGTTLRARFAPARAGRLTVQVVAELAAGPRPVLEATVFVDAEPAGNEAETKAPGEEAPGCLAPGAAGEACALGRMLRAARASEGLPPLAEDETLAAVARAHAARMARMHQLAHDAGDGNARDRVLDAGIDAREVDENLVHAPTMALAHRALWDSPVHRATMLRSGMVRAGVGVVRDELGEAWAVVLETR